MLENFKTAELFDKETYELLGDQAMKLLDIRLKMTIDSIRKKLGYPMVVNDWSFSRKGSFQKRCFRTQKSTTGAKAGSHFRGMGVDFDCYKKGVMIPAERIRKLIYKHIDQFPYIRCIETDINWVHVDVMGQEDSDRRRGIDEYNVLLWSPKSGSKVVTRHELEANN